MANPNGIQLEKNDILALSGADPNLVRLSGMDARKSGAESGSDPDDSDGGDHGLEGNSLTI